MLKATLGIDTSCYTTSVALACSGKVLASKRKLLTVGKGQRGLRQSEALFQHIKALPVLLKELLSDNPDITVSSVCVSAKPLDENDSYMPVFLAGKSAAEAISSSMRIPVFYTSHQQGHIRAALVESGMPHCKFLALHLSGGTTQTLCVDDDLVISNIGGTSDLNAGQLVDRTGVILGLGFPSGPELEKLALNGNSKSALPVSKNGALCSFSGAEAQILRMIDKGGSREDIAAEVYSFLSRSVAELILSASKKTGVGNVLLAGGVASSKLLRNLTENRLSKKRANVKLYWAKPELSGDNACGVALIGDELYRENRIWIS